MAKQSCRCRVLPAIVEAGGVQCRRLLYGLPILHHALRRLTKKW
jgi:hypothetical protein